MSGIILAVVVIVGVLLGALLLAAGIIWVERRLLGVFQERYGPNRAGPFGVLQVVADMLKIFTKENWIPPFADKAVFVIAPAIIMITTLASFAVIPIAPAILVSDLDIGLLFFLAMSSFAVYSVALAGWASNNKYSLLGSIRAVGQMVSYEVFMGLSLMGVVLQAGSFSMRDIVLGAEGAVVRGPAVRRLRGVLHRGAGRDAPHPVRPSRGGERAGGRLPHGVLRVQVRHVLHRGVRRHHADLHDGRHALLRRLAGARAFRPSSGSS